MKSIDSIQNDLEMVKERLSKESSNQVQIIGVTKNHSPEIFEHCHKLGIKHLGENKAQEVRDKSTAIHLFHAQVHFIGNIQKKNIKYLKNNITSFDSLWDMEVAGRLSQLWEGEKLPILIQVNTTNEPHKSGIAGNINELLKFIDNVSEYRNLEIEGIMTMGPTPDKMTNSEWEKQTLLAFERAWELLQKLRSHTRFPLPRLSMGMSNDYFLAARQGATEVRLGSVLFGPRNLSA